MYSVHSIVDDLKKLISCIFHILYLHIMRNFIAAECSVSRKELRIRGFLGGLDRTAGNWSAGRETPDPDDQYRNTKCS